MALKITLVKKILENGEECKKCKEVTERLEANNEMNRIDRVVYADARDLDSEGYKLAQKHKVDAAPFFIVEESNKTEIYTAYMKLRKEVFNQQEPDESADEDTQQNDPNEDLYWM